MRFARSAWLGLMGIGLLWASADKKLPIEESSNEYVDIRAALILDKDQIHQELGADLPQGIVLVKVTVRPMGDKAWRIDRDDFFLLDGNLGERAVPYAPSQIAGNSSLIVTQQGARNGRGPTFGVGLGGIGMGGSGSSPGETKVTVQNSDKTEESPLLKALKEKVLLEREISDPVSGLLYFQMDGKIKAKDLEMYYKTPGGRLALRFRP